MAENSMKAGVSKSDITPKTKNIAMLGYGTPSNLVKSVETPLCARALYLEDDDEEGFFLVNLEICFVTDSIFRPLVEKASQITGKNMQESVLITAQHTHAAPGGFDHYPLYNTPTPGFVPEVLETVLAGAQTAMQAAFESRKKAKLDLVQSEFGPEVDVAFNRSMSAYSNNPEVEAQSLPMESRLAVDRFSRLLRIKSEGDKYIGLLNWFGVHCTSIPNSNTAISPDNKGYAALEVEKSLENKESGFTAFFNQGNAGDVSPNFIWDPDQKLARGPHKDSFENARFNGFLQAKKTLEMSKSETAGIPIQGKIQKSLIFKDMGKVYPSRKYLPEGAPSWARTTSACHGVAFAQGTKEGPGVHPALGFVLKVAATLEKLFNFAFSFQKDEEDKKNDWLFYKNQEPKSIFVKAGKRQIFGIENLSSLPIPNFVDPLIATFKKQYRANALSEHTWTQERLPVQLIKIGNLLLAALPGETSTIAGLRIKRQLKGLFEGEELTVIVSPYSNAYCGYIVTPEEYEAQEYEGGHTVFGKWTLPAFQTVLEEAVKKLKDSSLEIEQEYPPQFSDVVLKARSL